MVSRLIANVRSSASLFMTGDQRVARLLVAEKEIFEAWKRRRRRRIRTTARRPRRHSQNQLDTPGGSADLKRINSHLVAAAAYPLLEGKGVLSSRLRQED